MRYKAIALDIDGTLTNSKKEVSDKTRLSLIEAQKAGFKLILASGRPTIGLEALAKKLEFDKFGGILLSYNGGNVVDYLTGKCLYEKVIDLNAAKEVLKFLKEFNVTAMITENDTLVVEDKNGYKVDYESEINKLKIKEVSLLSDYIKKSPCKILVSGNHDELNGVLNKVKERFSNEIDVYFSAEFYLEIVAKGINKATSLKGALEKLNIKRDELIAFGDERNDMTMIEFAGLGVAMGNAIKELKEIANEVTLSNDEDGIAHTINRILREGK